jgi:phage tail sheath protein FI
MPICKIIYKYLDMATYKTPGVYIQEINAFPNSAVPIATAVPAFIGYTEFAERQKKSLILQPTKISSFGEYLQFFGGAPVTKLTLEAGTAAVPFTLAIKESYFTLHSQMAMFFSNGGTDCYIVSVGSYTNEDGTPNAINLEALQTGIAPLLKEMEPTILVIPEAVHAPVNVTNLDEDVKAIYILYQEMLKHCGMDMRNRFAITDVWMNPSTFGDPGYNMRDDIRRYREGIGSNNLMWGAAYYPWLHTSAIAPSGVSLLNIDNIGAVGDVKSFPEDVFNEHGGIVDKAKFKIDFVDGNPDTLLGILDQSLNQDVLNGAAKASFATQVKAEILTPLATLDRNNVDAVNDANKGLLAVSTMYNTVLHDLRKRLNLLPPSAAMAGVYSMVDNQVGVFQAPANVGLNSVLSPALNISNEQQQDMNVPIDGKAVNAIRSFPGRGVLVWGARTLDGNSQDWRYISVRRTVTFIEQSIKLATEPYVFEPNTAPTWSNIKAMIDNFLNNTWQAGALAGATPEDAFSVDVGLGSTMTTVDILDGYMRIIVKIAVARPAEFIVITFQQKMQQS